MKVHVKGQKIQEIVLEIFRGRKIGVAHQCVGVHGFDRVRQGAQECAHPLGAVPSDHFRGDFIADEIGKDSGVAVAREDAAGDVLANLRPGLFGI